MPFSKSYMGNNFQEACSLKVSKIFQVTLISPQLMLILSLEIQIYHNSQSIGTLPSHQSTTQREHSKPGKI